MLFLDSNSIKTVDPDSIKGAAEVEVVYRATSNETKFKLRQTVYEEVCHYEHGCRTKIRFSLPIVILLTQSQLDTFVSYPITYQLSNLKMLINTPCESLSQVHSCRKGHPDRNGPLLCKIYFATIF